MASSKVTYGDFQDTGYQDADNVISMNDFDFSSGNTAEEIVDASMKNLGFDDGASWIDQQELDDFDGLDPQKAYEAWRAGWRSSAIVHVEQQMFRHLTKSERQFKEALLLADATNAIDVAQDIALENNLKLWQVGEHISTEDSGEYYEGESHGLFELERGLRGTSVRWNVEQRAKPGLQLVMRYEFQGTEWTGAAFGTLYSNDLVTPMTLAEARRYASEYAWTVTKLFAKTLLDLGDRKISPNGFQILQDQVEKFEYREPVTPEEMLQNPLDRVAHGKATAKIAQKKLDARRAAGFEGGCDDPQCPGWDVFETEGGRHHGLAVQVCDECNQEAKRLGLPTIADHEAKHLPDAVRALRRTMRLRDTCADCGGSTGPGSPDPHVCGGGELENPAPEIRQEESAVDKYREFNSFDPKKLVYVDGSPIPQKLRCLGEATQIVYESMKVIPDNGVKPKKPQGYFHDHEGDVYTYVPDAGGDTDTPDFVLECDALALIGTCIEFSYKDEDGKKGKGKATKPYPEVYCTPNGRALVIIQSKKTVLAIIYGGALGVESRGIVG